MNLLLEIGAEEIPDWMIRGALEAFQARVGQLLVAHGLSGSLTADATARRLTLRGTGIAERQADSEERVTGPAKAAPAGAVAGFAKKLGVTAEELEPLVTPKGEYWSYLKKVPGRASIEILAGALPEIVAALPFPKTMYWTGKGGTRFIRPIRWIVALLGEQVIPFEIAGVRAGSESSGHRRLGKARFPVTFENYEEQLLENGVILSAEKRRQKITSGIPVRIKPDPELLEILVYLTEFPAPIVGSFDPRYLELPDEVLITVMRHHQKYFSVEDASGKLAPQFVAVMNIGSDPKGYVQSGNERVLKARFNDARFFWDVDQKRPLRDRLEDLKHVTFQAKLGSYFDKIERMKQIFPDEAAVNRAIELCKCDLTTELVKEFTELQGVVGGLYARAQGEPEEVAVAIYDHYKPVSMEGEIPRTREGQFTALADKLDTLQGCFAIGLIPSGSKDPFALRRAAQGVVRILVEGRHRLDLAKLLGDSEPLREFLLDRIRYYFRDVRGFAYDEVNAVLASGWSDVVDVEERLLAIQRVRPTADFEPLAGSFKRIRNILKQAQFTTGGAIDAGLLESGPESELNDAFQQVRSRLTGLSYSAALETIASLRPQVDRFFDKVLVNAKDESVRRNRLTLLHTLLAEFSTIADFSEIVTTA